jgi:diamine N-acetyltransferase
MSNPLHIQRLDPHVPGDLRALQILHEAAPGYSRIVHGRDPDGSEALETLTALPPGRTLAHKAVVGFSLGEDLVGCVELLRDYPEPGIAWIGLLLFAESHQGRGYGPRALRHAAAWATDAGCTELRCAVIETNARAHAFWLREGFRELHRRPAPGCTGEAIVLARANPWSDHSSTDAVPGDIRR